MNASEMENRLAQVTKSMKYLGLLIVCDTRVTQIAAKFRTNQRRQHPVFYVELPKSISKCGIYSARDVTGRHFISGKSDWGRTFCSHVHNFS
jgi:hypothetical protein